MVQLHHVALGAEDVRRVADFYSQAFRLLVMKEHHYDDGRLRSIWLRTGDTILMIEHCSVETSDVETSSVETSEPPPHWVQGVGKGAFLLAFAVTESEMRAAEASLVSLGAVIESRSEYSVYARDPEGNRVALSHFPVD